MDYHKHFNTAQEFAKFGEDSKVHDVWGFSVKKALDRIYNGCTEFNDLVESFYNKISEEVEVPRREYVLSHAGAFPSVPEYLRYNPMHMYQQINVPRNTNPVHIYVGISASGGFSDKEYAKRGAAISALAVKLSSTRPVFITCYTNIGHGNDNSIISWDITTSPIVLSEITGSIANHDLERTLDMQGNCAAINKSYSSYWGAWHKDYMNPVAMKQHLNCNENDIYLGSFTYEDPVYKDPVAWCKKELARFTDEQF